MKALILFLLVACQQNNWVVLAAQDDVARQDLQIVAPDINKAIGCDLLAVPGQTSSDWQRRRFVNVTNDAHNTQNQGEDTLGFYNPYTEDVYYVPFEGGKDYVAHMQYIVLVHELGHVLGLDHEEGTAMQAELKNQHNADAVASLVDLLNKHGLNPCMEAQ